MDSALEIVNKLNEVIDVINKSLEDTKEVKPDTNIEKSRGKMLKQSLKDFDIQTANLLASATSEVDTNIEDWERCIDLAIGESKDGIYTIGSGDVKRLKIEIQSLLEKEKKKVKKLEDRLQEEVEQRKFYSAKYQEMVLSSRIDY
jgi:hypothetical protein